MSGGGFTPPRHGCCVQAPNYIWDPARGGVLEGGGPVGGLPPPGTAAVSKHQTISGTQHEGACSRGVPGGRFTPPRHGCCVQASDYIWDPTRRGVLEGGGPGGGLPPPGTAAVSKHQTVTFVFVLKITLPRRNLASLCPGRRVVRPRISTPLQHLRF